MENVLLYEFICGSMLGDGSLSKISHGAKNSRLTFGHGEKQLSYLEWKHSFLKNYNLEGKIIKNQNFSQRYKKGYCISYHFKSKSNELFTNIRNLFYINNKKCLNQEYIEKYLSPFALAIWFMDDGNICTRSYQINSHSFSQEEIDFLITFLFNKYNLQFTSDKNKVLYLRTKSIKTFEKLIQPYIFDFMKYKIRVLNKSDKLLENPEMDNQQPI